MPRPKSKEDLLELSQANYHKLFELIDTLTPEEKGANFPEGLSMQTSTLVTNHRYAPCKEGEYRAISNFLIELKDTRLETYSNPQLYDFESRFQYLQISDNGEINRLTSNRYFDATKFVKLEERHFRGCFVNRMKKSDEDGYYNLWKFDHLAIDDLDIMRNEIFADYGYRFKSEKWQKYFAKKSWYKPRFDDVNDQLSEIDKANIQFILNMEEFSKIITSQIEVINNDRQNNGSDDPEASLQSFRKSVYKFSKAQLKRVKSNSSEIRRGLLLTHMAAYLLTIAEETVELSKIETL